MKLSKLIYLAIKNVNYFDDSSFTYEYFIGSHNDNVNANYDNGINTDYSLSVENIYTPLNEAIQRLSDLEKIPYKIKELNVSNNLVTLGEDVKEAIGVATLEGERIPFAPYGVGKIKLLRCYRDTTKVMVEYKEEIPTFDKTCLLITNGNDYDGLLEYQNPAELLENDVELSSYGINNAMCQYIIEYCQGKLEEQIDPSLANMHFTRAEQYFSNLKMATSIFVQEVVRKKYTIE